MGKKRGRYENAGRIKSIHTVNFRDADEILTILESFRGNEAMEGHIAELYIKMQAILVDYLLKLGKYPLKQNIINMQL